MPRVPAPLPASYDVQLPPSMPHTVTTQSSPSGPMLVSASGRSQFGPGYAKRNGSESMWRVPGVNIGVGVGVGVGEGEQGGQCVGRGIGVGVGVAAGANAIFWQMAYLNMPASSPTSYTHPGVNGGVVAMLPGWGYTIWSRNQAMSEDTISPTPSALISS